MPFDRSIENQKSFVNNSKIGNQNQYFINNTHNSSKNINKSNNINESKGINSHRSSFKPIIQENENISFTSNTKNNFDNKKGFNASKSSEPDDLFYLQDSVHDFGERVKKLDDYLSSLEKHFFIYNNDIEKNNTSINANYNGKTTKLTNNSHMEENLIDYLKPILK